MIFNSSMVKTHHDLMSQWQNIPSKLLRWSTFSVYILVVLSLITFPIDAFVGLFPTNYRPLSIIFLLIAFVFQSLLLLFEQKWNIFKFVFKRYGILIAFFMVSLVVSWLRTRQFTLPLDGFFNGLFTLGLGGIAFVSYDLFFRLLNQTSVSFESWVGSLLSLMAWVYAPLVIFGILEVLIFFQWLPLELKENIVVFFARKAYPRVQWLSGEPSWAAMQMIFSMPFLLYKAQKNLLFKIVFGLSVVVLVLSFSMQGLFTFIIVGFIGVIVLRPKWIFKMIIALGILLVITLGFYYLASTLYPRAHFLTRLRRAMNISSLIDLVYLDGSVAVRLLYPWIGLVMFRRFPLFGVGVGNYRYFFPNIVRLQFPRLLRVEEVTSNIRRLNSNPKNIFTRLMGEGGLVGSALFSWFTFKSIKAAWNSVSIHRDWIILILIVVFANMLQFDSYAYVPLWFILALSLNSPQKNDQLKES
jgi:hypothetical protein